MAINRKSRTTINFTSKKWSIAFLTKRTLRKIKNNTNVTNNNLTNTNIELILSKTSRSLLEWEKEIIINKYLQLDSHEIKRLMKILKSRKNKIEVEEILEWFK